MQICFKIKYKCINIYMYNTCFYYKTLLTKEKKKYFV